MDSKEKFEGNAKELKALRNIYLNSEKITNDPIAKKEISSQIDHLERMLINGLKYITQSVDLSWIHQGKKLKIKHVLDIQSHLSNILEDIYYHSPILRNELINRDNISSSRPISKDQLNKMMGNREMRMLLSWVMRRKNSLLIRLFSMPFLINQVCIRKLILDIFLPIQRKVIRCFQFMSLLKIRYQKMSLSLTSNYVVSSQNLHLESKKACIL